MHPGDFLPFFNSWHFYRVKHDDDAKKRTTVDDPYKPNQQRKELKKHSMSDDSPACFYYRKTISADWTDSSSLPEGVCAQNS